MNEETLWEYHTSGEDVTITREFSGSLWLNVSSGSEQAFIEITPDWAASLAENLLRVVAWLEPTEASKEVPR